MRCDRMGQEGLRWKAVLEPGVSAMLSLAAGLRLSGTFVQLRLCQCLRNGLHCLATGKRPPAPCTPLLCAHPPLFERGSDQAALIGPSAV